MFHALVCIGREGNLYPPFTTRCSVVRAPSVSFTPLPIDLLTQFITGEIMCKDVHGYP